MSFAFGTKAETLDRLRAHLQGATFCEQLTFTVGDWERQRDDIVKEICGRFVKQRLAVRSSAKDEDGWESSKAGVYRSLIDVVASPASVIDAVMRVIESYRDSEPGHQVLVQPMVRDVAISGVVLSRDLDTLSPYYSINYDDFSGRTDTVTGGGVSKAMLVLRARLEGLHSPRFRKLLDLVRQIEAATGCDELDIEFCIVSTDEIIILQVRPLTMATGAKPGAPGGFEELLDDVHDELQVRMRPAPGMLGGSTLFGEMPDWNPAEMIGSAPKPLALSTYKYLITDSIWRRSRERMGYRPMPEVPLLVDFAGRPFIDVRASLNSFLPRGIEEALGQRFMDAQLARLHAHPEFHDKIEFEIGITCRDFGFDQRAATYLDAGLTRDDIESLREKLTDLTRAAIEGHTAKHARLEGDVEELERRRDRKAGESHRERAGRLLGDCLELGTLPFADLARHAFIGISFLKSLVARGVFSEDDSERFLRSVRTIAGTMVHDMHDLMNGEKSVEDFLVVYGHLRPGTYDILSWRYDERPDLYLGHSNVPLIEPEPFVLSAEKRRVIDLLLAEARYGISADELLAYIASSVRLRENSKFQFSRSVSDALVALSQWGEEESLSRDDLSYLEIGDILSANGRSDWHDKLSAARSRYGFTRALRLPHLIAAPEDVYVVRLPLGHPNFITHKVVTAPSTLLRAGEFPNIDGSIVLTESADPGFDWIFSHEIAGLVTKFGGANSHMAIRCAEFGMPAAIGCGERAFSNLVKANIIELNAGNRSVRAVR